MPTPRIAPDPDDDIVIGTALAAKADLVVTGDKPLLSVAESRGSAHRRRQPDLANQRLRLM